MLRSVVLASYSRRRQVEYYIQVTLRAPRASVGLRTSVIILMAAACATASAQNQSDQELARLLANDNTRQSAVAKVLASQQEKVPLLLSWTRALPAHVDKNGLYIGLGDVFGKLRTNAAIPFLIKNISRRRTGYVDLAPWLKVDKAIEDTFPAVTALIEIGPDASKALIRACQGSMLAEDRLAAIFVVSRIKEVPEARAFLTAVLGEATM